MDACSSSTVLGWAAPRGAQSSLCCEQQQWRQSKAPSSSSSHPTLGKPVLSLPSPSQALLHPPNTPAHACRDCTRVQIGETCKPCTRVQTGTRVQALHSCAKTQYVQRLHTCANIALAALPALPCSSWPPSYPISWQSGPAPQQAPCWQLAMFQASEVAGANCSWWLWCGSEVGAAGMGQGHGAEQGEEKGKREGRKAREESRKEVWLSRPVINSCQASEIARGRAKYSPEQEQDKDCSAGGRRCNGDAVPFGAGRLRGLREVLEHRVGIGRVLGRGLGAARSHAGLMQLAANIARWGVPGLHPTAPPSGGTDSPKEPQLGLSCRDSPARHWC